MPTITLEHIADEAILKAVWRKAGLRKLKRQQGLNDFELAHDPLEFVWFDWELDRHIKELSAELRSGRFMSDPPEFVREAKSLGLSRPLAYLTVRDQIVYKTIVARAESALLADMYSWARFGRADANEDAPIGRDSGWFRAWLERQNQLWTITAGHDYLVETDIANFFPSVPIQHLLDHVRSTAALRDEVVRLLERVLRSCSPAIAYRSSASVGLPQENHDASRVLAHSYLVPIDREFETEGKSTAYSRWMDDIVVGTGTVQAALNSVKRIQRSMEPLGLYPNTSKTKIMTSSEFIVAYMKPANDYLGDVDQRITTGTLSGSDRSKFHKSMTSHLNLKPQPKAWERVLRRYYTSCRLMDCPNLRRFAVKHLTDYPGSAPNILEYLRGYQLTEPLVVALERASSTLEGIYEDVPLLIQEFLATCPTDGRKLVRVAAVNAADAVLSRALPTNRRLAAAAALTKAKFGGTKEWSELAEKLKNDSGPDDAFRRQLATIAFGTGTLTIPQIWALPGWRVQDSLNTIRYLEAVSNGNKQAVHLALAIAAPVERSRPVRPSVRPRAVVLIPALRAAAPAVVNPQVAKWRGTLQKARARFRDRITERFMS